ncbi:hypothetical protein ACQP2P_29950 [Dactylosporangium sp. CA-139114]|uniref:hypothetical protein n=1 Tax=Dactylosporangium sp. CA-139114 TaxID=3239931 RepID=UPI003D982D54
MRAVKVLTTAVAGAVVAGAVLGALSRVFMRLLTLAAGGAPGFSWSGTFFIVLIYVVAVAPAALTAAFTTGRWRWLAAVAGAALLMVPAIGVSSEEIGDVEGISAMAWIGLAAASVAVFTTVFVAPAAAIWLVDRLKGRAPVVGSARQSPEPALAGASSSSATP